jgi:hypothetical protein
MLHVPLPSSLSMLVVPAHSNRLPDIAVGAGLTLNTMLRLQPDGIVYTIVVVPTESALTRPDVPIVAAAVLLLLQVPPRLPSDNDTVLPTHAFVPPLTGKIALTVTVIDIAHPPAVL